MKGFKNSVKIILIATFSAGICGCSPLSFKIFIRNTTSDTAHLTLFYKSEYNILKTNIQVLSKNEVLEINNKTLIRLNEKLIAIPESRKIALTIPPKTTVYLSDLINSLYLFTDKILIIQHGNKSDTMIFNYPYRKLKGIRRKRDKAYNYFYRTIIYYDIKQD